MKKLASAIALTLALALVLSACAAGSPSPSPAGSPDQGETSSSPAAENSPNPDEKEVKLTFYTMNSPLQDFDRIMAKANAIIKEKINATLDLIPVDGSTYAEKLNLAINSSEAFDLCFTANWGDLNYFQNAAKGAYLDITDLIHQYAPQSYSRIPESLWDGVKVNGKIFGVVNYQQWGISVAKGVGLRRDLAEEYGFDWKAIKKLEDLEPFMQKVRENRPDMVPFEYVNGNDVYANNSLLFGMDSVGDTLVPGWVSNDGGRNPIVVNQYETDAYKAYLTMMRRWYQAGYLRKDAATLKDFMPDRQANRVAVQLIQQYPDSITEPAQIPTQKMSHTVPGEAPQVTVNLSLPFVPSTGPATAVTAIGANSKNPERALKLVELLNTNDELFNLITLGEKDVDWKYLETDDAETGAKKGTYTPIAGKYNYNWMEWALGQSFSPSFSRAAYDDNEAGELNKKIQGIIQSGDKTSKTSPVMGFTFDTTNVRTEIANCSAIIDEMVPALGSGSVDPETKLPEFISRLQSAGVQKIIDEKQRQIDEWLKSNG